MSENKDIEKKIAKIVKSELDKSNYEDTAWLKAFKEAKGDKNQARAIYVGIRSKDLEDEFYDELSRIEHEKLEKQSKIEQEKVDREKRLQQLRLKKEELKQNRKNQESQKSSYNKSTSTYNSFLETSVKPFFRGEFDLYYSYWMVGFVYSLIFSLPLFILSLYKSNPSGFGGLIYFIYCLAFVAWVIFVNIGIWRSAGFYVIKSKQNNESGFWGYVARLIVILSYIRMIASFIHDFNK
jgi:hypothetical protein